MTDQTPEPAASSAPKILVAVDHSRAAADAAVLAYQVFGEEAEYTVVSVAKGDAAALRDAEGDLPSTIPFDMVAATERGEAQETATAVAASALGGWARVAGLVSPRPGILICKIADKMNADFIVIGSPSRGRWRQLVTRSVGQYIARRAPCPVLIAPTPAD